MLKQRVVTAFILSSACISAILSFPAPWLEWLAALVVVVMGGWEWARLSGFPLLWQRVCYALTTGAVLLLLHNTPALLAPGEDIPVLLAIGMVWWCLALALVLRYPASVRLWRFPLLRLGMGWLVLLPAWAGLVALVGMEPDEGILSSGRGWLLYLFALVWGADVGAYFAGRRYGKRRLAPHVSPGKTWEGVLGSLAVTSLLAAGTALYTKTSWPLFLVLLVASWAVNLVAVLGDLLESMFKREQGFKDSGTLFPGHGGLLDRIDSLTAAAPVFATLCLLLPAPF